MHSLLPFSLKASSIACSEVEASDCTNYTNGGTSRSDLTTWIVGKSDRKNRTPRQTRWSTCSLLPLQRDLGCRH
ncbi:hypothetical protein CONLIGDRAFT_514998 [Coniochaeta ligniaria NRRL 30616]|uniref:Uncharacterized protein n=1 Tax=Coniochaeta ligniaria NRRL 30616 TaxID=1408157 RepID=A0A1J7JEI5_9PEZI|nr:hypothetical protein CONLIGDRAFT_514998 [Coniochaeta ligniaria NRRL 30616]